jgi:lipoprotein-releasing system permease protein
MAMLSRFEWMIAGRYLRPRKEEGFISVIAGFSLLGIALGVATLIVVMAVMNGFRAELLGRILGLNGHVMVQGVGRNIADYDGVAEALRKAAGVKSATPIVEGQVMAMVKGEARGALVRGIKPEDLKARDLIASKIITGKLDNFGGKDKAVVGHRLAMRLGLMPGDRLTLVAPQTSAGPFGAVPRMRSYEIAATFEVGMYEYDSTFVYLPLKAAQIFFRTGDRATAIETFVQNPDNVPATRKAIRDSLKGPYRLYDWQQANSHFFQALQVERNVMFLILTLIIIVAAFNIISSLIMLVKDKGSDIAILRTMGATRGSIMRVFVISGASVGVLGTVLGAILGISFASNIDVIRIWLEGLTGAELWAAEIRFLSHLPARIDSGEVISVVLMALGLSFLATLYPSWRASRLDPVEALRYE